MTWITRENASVDHNAEFLSVPAEQVMAVVECERVIPYDVPTVELGHVDVCCSFESIMRADNLMDDKSLVALATIAHAADVTDDSDTSPRWAHDPFDVVVL